MRLYRLLAACGLVILAVAPCAVAEIEFTNLFSFPLYELYGGQPDGGLTRDRLGNLYGTTSIACGTCFEMTSAGTMLWSHSLCGRFGAQPKAELLRIGADFYGTCFSGGSHDNGTVFRMRADGSLVWSESFDGANGANPEGGLIEGKDHNFFGTTSRGGTKNFGTIFRITPSGSITALYSFSGGLDGAQPIAGLVQGADGNLYGTTAHGGLISAGTRGPVVFGGNGTIFKATPAGTLKDLVFIWHGQHRLWRKPGRSQPSRRNGGGQERHLLRNYLARRRRQLRHDLRVKFGRRAEIDALLSVS
jgi:uncharacterized repeat protein (TIGR03803 family)